MRQTGSQICWAEVGPKREAALHIVEIVHTFTTMEKHHWYLGSALQCTTSTMTSAFNQQYYLICWVSLHMKNIEIKKLTNPNSG